MSFSPIYQNMRFKEWQIIGENLLDRCEFARTYSQRNYYNFILTIYNSHISGHPRESSILRNTKLFQNSFIYKVCHKTKYFMCKRVRITMSQTGRYVDYIVAHQFDKLICSLFDQVLDLLESLVLEYE